MLEKVLAVVFMLALLGVLGWVAQEQSECSARGGALVRVTSGLPECVEVR